MYRYEEEYFLYRQCVCRSKPFGFGEVCGGWGVVVGGGVPFLHPPVAGLYFKTVVHARDRTYGEILSMDVSAMRRRIPEKQTRTVHTGTRRHDTTHLAKARHYRNSKISCQTSFTVFNCSSKCGE